MTFIKKMIILLEQMKKQQKYYRNTFIKYTIVISKFGKKWIQGHHKTPDMMRFIKKDYNFTGTDEEVVEILPKHFYKIYNSNIKIDWSVLDNLVQNPSVLR